jgi:virulence factor
MRAALIGLGDIAEKAYLPALAGRGGLELSLMTRDGQKLDRIGDAWRIDRRFTSLEALISGGIDAAFVHAATQAHAEIVERLLEAGVHVYVDKPLSDRLEDCERLVELAERRGRSLMVGFNRRFAPDYAALIERPRDLVVMQKHRTGPLEAPRRTVFDDFSHVIDTLRFLAPEPVERTSIETRVEAGLLRQVVLTLSGAGFTAIGAMSREAGATEETLEVVGGGARRRIVDLGEVVDEADGQRSVRRRPDWSPVAAQRGIAQACEHFIAAVRDGRPISARDALETHRLCEHIVGEIEAKNAMGSGVSA